MHVRPGDPHPIADIQQRLDSRFAIVGRGRKADDGLAAPGSRRATDETRLRRHPAVEFSFKLVDADLARQVDCEGLGDRYHARLTGDLFRIAHLIDRQELKARIVVYQVVEPPRPQAVAGDDTIAMTGFTATGHYARLDQVHNSIGYDVAMDAEIAPIPEITQRLIWDAAQSYLQSRAVVDDRGNIARDALRNLADLWMKILRDRDIDLHQRIEAVEMDEALAVGARHRWIDFRDNHARDTQDRGCEVHRHPEADKAPSVRRGNLKQCHVDR